MAKYDLIVVGGGPGGLMAAKTAAEDGLKVLLIERKKNITEIKRTCLQIFYIRKLSASRAGLHGDGYIEPVSVEVNDHAYRFHFPGPGFSLDYTGPLKSYYHWIEISPSKASIYRRKDTIWGYFYDKETFLAELLASAQKAGAEILKRFDMPDRFSPAAVATAPRDMNGQMIPDITDLPNNKLKRDAEIARKLATGEWSIVDTPEGRYLRTNR